MITVDVRDDLAGNVVPADARRVELIGRLAAAIDQPSCLVGQVQLGARRAVATREGTTGSMQAQREGWLGRGEHGAVRAKP